MLFKLLEISYLTVDFIKYLVEMKIIVPNKLKTYQNTRPTKEHYIGKKMYYLTYHGDNRFLTYGGIVTDIKLKSHVVSHDILKYQWSIIIFVDKQNSPHEISFEYFQKSNRYYFL